MTQPPHVPQQDTDRVRPSFLLPAPQPWYRDRPAELAEASPPWSPRLGSTGPDLGYGLKLARRLEGRLDVPASEDRVDVVAGGFACGARRSAYFGRAPVIQDMEWAFGLWGYLGGAPEDLVAWRAGLFRGAAHHYWDQRQIVDAVRPETLRLTSAQVREQLDTWRQLLIV